MVLLADDDEILLQREAQRQLEEVKAHANICAVEWGRVMRNAQNYAVEHFGFVDGRSQPLFFESDIERERQQRDGTKVWPPGDGPNLVLVPDPNGRSEYDSGSYLVFRVLPISALDIPSVIRYTRHLWEAESITRTHCVGLPP